mmetsp:Transcript_1368/g.3523  ORF Transcript_1368/g.3523 Transcript_1368/m.3523 type:complete len:252 (-) Transcript_1368:356-1111(-)
MDQRLFGVHPRVQNAAQAVLPAGRENVPGVHVFGEHRLLVGIGNGRQPALDVPLNHLAAPGFRQRPQERSGGVPHLPQRRKEAKNQPLGDGVKEPGPPLGLFFRRVLRNPGGAEQQEAVHPLGVFLAVGDAEVAAHGVPGKRHLFDLVGGPPGLEALDEKGLGGLDRVVPQQAKGGTAGETPAQEVDRNDRVEIVGKAGQVAVKIEGSVHVAVDNDEWVLMFLLFLFLFLLFLLLFLLLVPPPEAVRRLLL